MAARQSNIELLRIIAMIMVLTSHTNEAAGDFSTFADGFCVSGFLRLFLELSCLVCVNSFIMISGWFGIKPSVRGFVSILFQLSFYSIIIAMVYSFVVGYSVSIKDTVISCLGLSYWFIPAYLVLYVLSPILNAYLDSSSKKDLLLTIALFFALQFLFGRFGDQGHFITGHSTISFIGLYLISGYLKRFPLKISVGCCFVIYLICTTILTCIGYFIGGIMLDGVHSVFHYNNPLIITSSIFFFLSFTQLYFQSKTINWFAASAFSIYLIHMNYMVKEDFRRIIRSISDQNNTFEVFGILLFIILFISVFSILVDKIRIYAWKPIQNLIDCWTS